MTGSSDQNELRIGLDVGGSKIEGILMSAGAEELASYRVATPRNDYAATIAAIVNLAATLMQGIPFGASICIAFPFPSLPSLPDANANSPISTPPLHHYLAVRLPHLALTNTQLLHLSNIKRTHASYSGLFWEQDAAGALSSMEGCSTGRAALAANGVTIRFRGPRRTKTPGPTAGADGTGAWKHGFRARAWQPIMPD